MVTLCAIMTMWVEFNARPHAGFDGREVINQVGGCQRKAHCLPTSAPITSMAGSPMASLYHLWHSPGCGGGLVLGKAQMADPAEVTCGPPGVWGVGGMLPSFKDTECLIKGPGMRKKGGPADRHPMPVMLINLPPHHEPYSTIPHAAITHMWSAVCITNSSYHLSSGAAKQ